MKSNELTYEQAIELFRYDAETGVLERKLISGRWKICGHKPNHSKGYGYVNVDGKKYLSHRLIWLLVHGEWPENGLDHIDRDRMNNRLENLRGVTPSENQHNRKTQRNNSSEYPGVSFDKTRNKYQAYIRINNKRINLGYFNTPEAAFTAYMIAKIQYHPTSPIAQEYLRELTVAG